MIDNCARIKMGGIKMEISKAMQTDLIRYVEEYGWEPRITSKIMNLRHGTHLTASDITALYAKYGTREVDPIQHLLNLEERFFPSANPRKTLIE